MFNEFEVAGRRHDADRNSELVELVARCARGELNHEEQKEKIRALVEEPVQVGSLKEKQLGEELAQSKQLAAALSKELQETKASLSKELQDTRAKLARVRDFCTKVARAAQAAAAD